VTEYNNPHSQKERRAQLIHDKQAATVAERQQIEDFLINRGRFAKPQQQGPNPEYAAGSNWTRDPVPDEPPLGVDVNAMEPVGEPHEVQASMKRKSAIDLDGAQGRSLAPSSAPLPHADVETDRPTPIRRPVHFED
jgi:hypothetical protein